MGDEGSICVSTVGDKRNGTLYNLYEPVSGVYFSNRMTQKGCDDGGKENDLMRGSS